jgi:DNA-3-methyladenine glycosylase
MIQPDHTYERWLEQDSLVVAPLLLGWELETLTGRTITAGRIVETEAYRGPQDPASHAFGGLTTRNWPMFETGGLIYVYRSYGLHACVNIVTSQKGSASAVLIRALEPTVGQDEMTRRRHGRTIRNLCNGPGNLTQALGIDISFSGSRIGESVILRPPKHPVPESEIIATTRVGITKAPDYPWRFLIKDNPFVSKKAKTP